MGDHMQIVEIVILAMVAAFIALRLRSVLGKRPEKQPEVSTERKSVTLPKQSVAPVSKSYQLDDDIVPVPEGTIPNLRLIFGPLYNPGLVRFLEGSKRAYEMILVAFWRGDMQEVHKYIDTAVMKDFEHVINKRQARGEKVENRLVEITETKVINVQLKERLAEITVLFTSDIVAVVKDASGHLVDGDLSDTVRVNDIWIFARDLKTQDPNWMLIATSEA